MSALVAGNSTLLRTSGGFNHTARKAAQIVVAECSCSYRHETPEQAKARVSQYRQMEQMFADAGDDDEPEPPVSENSGFKLV